MRNGTCEMPHRKERLVESFTFGRRYIVMDPRLLFRRDDPAGGDFSKIDISTDSIVTRELRPKGPLFKIRHVGIHHMFTVNITYN